MNQPEPPPHPAPTPQPEQPFSAPWEAQVFAMTVHLHERGLFSWDEWATELSTHLHQPSAAADGSDYYHHWAAALEAMITTRAVTDTATVDDVANAWSRAAHATPHGQPIELANDPERHRPS